MEKFKAIQVANEIRDEDHAGDSQVEVIDEFSGNFDKFFDALGSGSLDTIPEVGEDDSVVSMEAKQQTKLYVLRGDKFEEVGGVPLRQDMLDNTDVFLLVGGKNQLFLWIGRQADKEEKLAALKAGEQFIDDGNFQDGANLVRVMEGLETALFKQFFAHWNEVDGDEEEGIGYFTESHVAQWKMEDMHTENRKRIERAGGSAPGFLPDDGSGEKTIWRVENFELQPVEDTGFLFGGDSYVIVYKGEKGVIIYYWQGKKSSKDERGASAVHAFQKDEEMDGQAVQIRVQQGEEPRHFLMMFGGTLVIFSGGKASGFKNVNDRDEYDEDGVRLFRVRSLDANQKDSRVEQVDEKASNLSSEDVFVLESKETCWIWKGKESSAHELEVAKGFMPKICPDREFQEVEEGSEEDDFWNVLGGKEEYGSPENRPILPVRLFHLRKMGSGKTRFIEILNFSRQDLVDDDIMILDTGKEIFIWEGKESSSDEKKSALTMAEEYLETDPSYRNPSNTVVILCKQGLEPDVFTQFFKDW